MTLEDWRRSRAPTSRAGALWHGYGVVMAALEIEMFSLTAGIDADTFRDLDEQMQEWCYLNRPGLARRTTARTHDGAYVVITLFGDLSDAIAIPTDTVHPVVASWVAAISAPSRSLKVYSLL